MQQIQKTLHQVRAAYLEGEWDGKHVLVEGSCEVAGQLLAIDQRLANKPATESEVVSEINHALVLDDCVLAGLVCLCTVWFTLEQSQVGITDRLCHDFVPLTCKASHVDALLSMEPHLHAVSHMSLSLHAEHLIRCTRYNIL